MASLSAPGQSASGDGTTTGKTVEHDELTGPEMEPADLAESLAIIEGTGCRLDFNNHSAA